MVELHQHPLIAVYAAIQPVPDFSLGPNFSGDERERAPTGALDSGSPRAISAANEAHRAAMDVLKEEGKA